MVTDKTDRPPLAPAQLQRAVFVAVLSFLFFLAMMIAASHKTKIAIGMGAWFLLGGVIANVWIPAPLWFKLLDLIVAYVPMTWLGAKLGGAGKSA